MKIKKWSEMSKTEKIATVVIGLFLVGFTVELASGDSIYKEPQENYINQLATDDQSEVKEPAKRQVQGETTTLITGSYKSPEDIKPGYYDVVSAGGSGNLYIKGSHRYNEILGGTIGVSKVRVIIAEGSEIEISGVSGATFTPIDAEYVANHIETSLYPGSFIVGQDIGQGRYIAKAGSGQSGNLFIKGSKSVNEILGTSFGTPAVTVDVKDGDEIEISGLETVIFTPVE